ncbi:pyruvate oxidase [Salimicrobium halophilum]|uniref:Pyruvate oxidase n=1 Tax=Salimicrobium halophilum TaxID=86666 RepID=A0A1G8TX39_9BACI|nr:pyruvate oxidase [Salimicrobium halophilum]SDJ46062.1 pyruvate oxidase [Salimicrobium halophilum]
MAQRTGAIMTDQLKNWGVEHIYGLPGDSINELIDDIRTSESLDFIQVRHEETASLAASSEAKLTGKLGVCLSIAGPGGVHMLNGLYDAKGDHAPVLAIVGQVSSTAVGTDAFQEINLERMFDDVAVFNKRAQSSEQLPDLLNQAIREAYAQKGVSVLIVPDNLFAEKQKDGASLTTSTYFRPNIFPAQEDMNAARELIEKAEKPVILAGKGTFGAQEELLSFAEKAGAPIILSLLAKGLIPDNHPYCLGHHGQIGTKPAYHAVKETDLLILIGTQFPYSDFFPEGVDGIQIDNKPENIGKYYPVTVGLAGDAKSTLSALTSTMTQTEDTSYLEKYQEKMNEWRISLQKEKREEKTPIQAPQVMYQVEKLLEPGAIVSADVGNVTVWASRFLPFIDQKFLISGQLATMGIGLPGALAAQIVHPDKQVLAICGDGGFSMMMHDFVTAVKYQLPIKVIVLNNEAIGMIQYEQQQMGHLNYQTDLGPVNFAGFAENCGGEGYRIESFDEMETKMKQAFLSDKPAIIDVCIEDMAPLPGHIDYTSAVNYTQYIIKNFFETGSMDLPDMKKAVKRLF